MITNGSRMSYLRDVVNELEREIISRDLQEEFIQYIQGAKEGKCRPVSDEEWKVLLPLERDELLFDYYLTARTELVRLQGIHEDIPMQDQLEVWIRSTPKDVVIVAAALADVATFILLLLSSGASFLSPIDGQSLLAPKQEASEE